MYLRKQTWRYTLDDIKMALIKHDGMVSKAAETLGCYPKTIRSRIKHNDELKDLLEEIREGTLDLAETQLIKEIERGNSDMIKFYLRYIGKSRGYTEPKKKIELTGSEEGPVEFKVIE